MATKWALDLLGGAGIRILISQAQARNDQFGDTTIEAALRRLDECEPGIEVAGVTDYGTTRGIREVLRTAAKMDFNNIRHLFPNVEARLGVQTAKHAYNLHQGRLQRT